MLLCISKTTNTQTQKTKRPTKFTGTKCICNSKWTASESMKQPRSLSLCINRLDLTIYFKSRHDVSIYSSKCAVGQAPHWCARHVQRAHSQPHQETATQRLIVLRLKLDEKHSLRSSTVATALFLPIWENIRLGWNQSEICCKHF